jgi:hypothetical protein
MSILTEQNILGNPELATATRPGKGTIAAKYAFSNGGYEMSQYKMAGKTTSSWTAPQSYSPSVDVAEVVENQTEDAGPAGNPMLSSPTEYGTQGGAPLTENAEQTSPLEQVAKVMAGESEEVVSVIPNYMSSAVKSEVIKEDGQSGPVASGGQFNGYEAMNQYYQNPMTEEITQPAPIEDTGLRSVFNANINPYEGMASTAASPGSDNPQANRGGSQPSAGNPQASRGKTAGSSAKKNQQPGSQPPRVHKIGYRGIRRTTLEDQIRMRNQYGKGTPGSPAELPVFQTGL